MSDHYVQAATRWGSSTKVGLDNLSVITPASKSVVKGLSLTATTGKGVVITGPCGRGKSALIRVVCGLWPVAGGHIVRPQEVSSETWHSV